MATLNLPNGRGDDEKESVARTSGLRPTSWVHSIQGSQTDLDSTSPSLRKQASAASPRISSEVVDTDEHEEPPLPYSKARCIALVVTTTGAAFTNVRNLLVPSCLRPFTYTQPSWYRFYQSKQSSLPCRQSAGISTYQIQDSNGSFLRMLFPLAASSCSGVALRTSTA